MSSLRDTMDAFFWCTRILISCMGLRDVNEPICWWKALPVMNATDGMYRLPVPLRQQGVVMLEMPRI